MRRRRRQAGRPPTRPLDARPFFEPTWLQRGTHSISLLPRGVEIPGQADVEHTGVHFLLQTLAQLGRVDGVDPLEGVEHVGKRGRERQARAGYLIRGAAVRGTRALAPALRQQRGGQVTAVDLQQGVLERDKTGIQRSAPRHSVLAIAIAKTGSVYLVVEEVPAQVERRPLANLGIQDKLRACRGAVVQIFFRGKQDIVGQITGHGGQLVGHVTVVERAEDGRSALFPLVSGLDGMDFLRFQIRIADPQSQRILILGERIEVARLGAVHPKAVIQPQLPAIVNGIRNMERGVGHPIIRRHHAVEAVQTRGYPHPFGTEPQQHAPRSRCPAG